MQVKSVRDALCGCGLPPGENMFALPDSRSRLHLRRFWDTNSLLAIAEGLFRIEELWHEQEVHAGKTIDWLCVVASRLGE